MVRLSLPAAFLALLPRVLGEQGADTVTLVQHTARTTEDAGTVLASPLMGLLGTMHLEATLRDEFLNSRAGDVGDVLAENTHSGEGDDLKSIYAGHTGDAPVTVEQKCTPAEHKVAEEGTKKMLQRISAKNGTGLDSLLPASCTEDMIYGQADLAKISRVNAQAYGLCVRQLTGISSKCSECMVGQVEGYQSCSTECGQVQSLCSKAAQSVSRPLQGIWPLQQMALGASLRSCSLATATCAHCTVKKLKDYVDCTGVLNVTQRKQYFKMVDDMVLGVATGLADMKKLGPKALDVVKQFR